ncbi:Os05g0282500 [Oryza sativa Japonica Group]|uniref:Os05g0282500 protein n=1 Tax=Oryza sativa subsp. japonica TaxID=39947 RepID=A0A0P0WK31_ORYSJ|nr:Os05g0282500 [Oryza sativa Japonica Group]
MHRRGCLLLSSLLWMLFTPCYATADTRSKGRPWVPNPAATASLLADLVNRSSGQALAVSMPDGVPQRYYAYWFIIGCILRNLEGNLPKANKISHETLMGCAKYTTMQPQGHHEIKNSYHGISLLCCRKVVPLDRNLRWPLLAGRLRRLGCLPVSVVKSALRRLRLKAFRLLAEWSSLVTLHLPLLYILAFSSSIPGSIVKVSTGPWLTLAHRIAKY